MAPNPLFRRGARTLVGVIHLPPLIGPDAESLERLDARVAADAQAYRDAGFDAVLVENYGDAPFPKDRSPPHVAAFLARAMQQAKSACALPVGVNVLRNDTESALGACAAADGQFVRVNVHTGAAVTDQGIIEGRAHATIRYRQALGLATGPRHVDLLADIDVKHAAPLVDRPIGAVAKETVERGHADVLLVTGSGTGAPVVLDDLVAVRRAVPDHPVLVASGLDSDNAPELMEHADGAIVGSAVKEGRNVAAPVDQAAARALVDAVRAHR